MMTRLCFFFISLLYLYTYILYMLCVEKSVLSSFDNLPDACCVLISYSETPSVDTGAIRAPTTAIHE